MALPDETGFNGWLRQTALPDSLARNYKKIKQIVVLGEDTKCQLITAAKELDRGLKSIVGQAVDVVFSLPDVSEGLIVLATVDTLRSEGECVNDISNLEEDGFCLDTRGASVKVIGRNERGVLYGAFQFLSQLSRADFSETVSVSNPTARIRYTNHWDNLDDSSEHGSIERGYGGSSIFFDYGFVLEDLRRVTQLARLLASIGINGAFINNVNAGAQLLCERNLNGIGRIADLMRPYGVRVGTSLFFDSPHLLGGLPTSDPLDHDVVGWWNDMTKRIYEHVPDLLGFLIKANSEGQPGPLTYGRTLADGANMFAKALKAYGDGILMYRAFVYNHHLDESNWKNDRANAAVEFFQHLDGAFDDNVVIQIKFGPIDFQVREPPSPLLACLRKTDIAIEFMVAQEYLGQQSHYVYQAPLWKTILDFDFKIDGEPSMVGRDILTGGRFGRNNNGYVAVTNIGNDPTWLGHHLSMSNLYAYGRLAWDSSLDARGILEEWIKLTFGLNEKVLDTIAEIAMETWPTYEAYSGNLGIQTLCDILYTHFGPSPATMDGNGWGQWTRASHECIGMDRTLATGTGNASQYPQEIAELFESIETTPEELLLWFHHVPYTKRLGSSGKTVIQHFYDEHYAGAANAQTFVTRFSKLQGLIDNARLDHIVFKLAYQAGHALVWRDSVNRFYHSKSGIADEGDRVNNHRWRIAAHTMVLEDYEVVNVTPAEAAMNGKAVVVATGKKSGSASCLLTQCPSNIYDIAVNYYDHLGGTSQYQLYLNQRLIGEWKGNLQQKLGHAFSKHLDGHSATRIYFKGVHVDHRAVLKIVGHSDQLERAPLDYVSVLPEGMVD